jgi:hypothetical protein
MENRDRRDVHHLFAPVVGHLYPLAPDLLAFTLAAASVASRMGARATRG